MKKCPFKMDRQIYKLRRRYHRRYWEVSGAMYFPDGWEDSEYDLYGRMLYSKRRDAIKASKREFITGEVELYGGVKVELQAPQIRRDTGRRVKFWHCTIH